MAGWTVHRYAVVGSTMDVAADAIAAGQIEGPTVFVSDHQDAGRGRADRAWRSVPGTALQMTAVLDVVVPALGLGPLPLLVGQAVADALAERDPALDLSLKWPNDVLVGGRKVAGILVVSRAAGNLATVRIGIGITILDSGTPDGSPTGLAHLAMPDGIDIVRDQLMAEILPRLHDISLEIATDGAARELARWSRRAAMLGEPVMVVDNGRERIGIMLGIDETGALLLQERDGTTITVVSGDLTRGPRPIPAQDPGTGAQ
ncbi:MAG TPA: biotin--[acetyl-CoA-carboxylase] ligase [Thermomicrobiales bacterium]|nr:biotin--[acetyl-CoA-carboxylase] ligase [Thermomicrobiales bacterium]